MKRFLVVSLILVLGLTLTLVGCTPKEETPKDQTQYITIATGGTGGVYFPLGGKLAELFNKHIPNMRAGAQSTGASIANVAFLKDSKVELAFIQNDIAYYAYMGTEMFKDKKVDNFLALATIYNEVVQLVVRADAGINAIEDLKGKKVAVGAAGSGTEANARQILNTFGVQYSDLGQAAFLSFSEAEAGLRDNTIDAAFITSGTPTAAVINMANSINVKVLPVAGPNATTLMNNFKHYAVATIPANTYKNQTEAVETVAVRAMIVVRKDLPDTLVYNMTKALFDTGYADWKAGHARANDLTLATAQIGNPIPLHPGAKKYFDEKK